MTLFQDRITGEERASGCIFGLRHKAAIPSKMENGFKFAPIASDI
jgi:hypothetical protein